MKSKAFISAALALIGILLIGGIVLYSQSNSKQITSYPRPWDFDSGTTTQKTPEVIDIGTTPARSPYKDGSYTAIGRYVSPGGVQSISVTVTLKDGVVSDVGMANGGVDGDSKQYQNKFISGVKQQVVGKKIDALSVSEVSGSSLTGRGFNDAIVQIQTQARA